MSATLDFTILEENVYLVLLTLNGTELTVSVCAMLPNGAWADLILIWLIIVTVKADIPS